MLRRCAGAIGRARRNVSRCVMSIRFELRCCRARRGFVVKFTKRWHFHRETRRCAGAIDPTRLHVLFLVMSSPILGADRVARDDAMLAGMLHNALIRYIVLYDIALYHTSRTLQLLFRLRVLLLLLVTCLHRGPMCGSRCSRRCSARGDAIQCCAVLYYATRYTISYYTLLRERFSFILASPHIRAEIQAGRSNPTTSSRCRTLVNWTQ